MPMVKKARRVTAADKRQKAILKKKLTGEVYDENRPTLSVSDADELIAFQAQFGKEAHEEAMRMAGRLEPQSTTSISATDSDDGNESEVSQRRQTKTITTESRRPDSSSSTTTNHQQGARRHPRCIPRLPTTHHKGARRNPKRHPPDQNVRPSQPHPSRTRTPH